MFCSNVERLHDCAEFIILRLMVLFLLMLLFKGYIAPAKIDPKLLDPKHIFKEVEPEGKKKISILQVEVNIVPYFLDYALLLA